MVYVSRLCKCNFYYQGMIQSKNISITINYTLLVKPDIINLLRFLCTDKILSADPIQLLYISCEHFLILFRHARSILYTPP